MRLFLSEHWLASVTRGRRPGSGNGPGLPGLDHEEFPFVAGGARRPRRSCRDRLAPGTRVMFRDHESDRDHGTSPRSGQERCSVITSWNMITEHRSRAPRPGPGRDGASPLNNQGSPRKNHTPVTWMRLLRGEAALAGGFSGSCRRVSASRRVDRTIRRQSSFMRQRSYRNPETLPGKHENPPGHGNAPPRRTKTLPKTAAPSWLTPKEPHRWDIDGAARTGHAGTGVMFRSHVAGCDHG